MPPEHRLVLDTNVLVRAFVNLRSASGRILQACERRRAVPLLSEPLLTEYRAILGHPALVERYPQLKRPEAGVSLERLRYIGDYCRRVKVRFSFPRDPKDALLIELALAGGATHLITVDDDLLALPTGRDEAARRARQRLPHLAVLRPEQYTERYSDPLAENDER